MKRLASIQAACLCAAWLGIAGCGMGLVRDAPAAVWPTEPARKQSEEETDPVKAREARVRALQFLAELEDRVAALDARYEKPTTFLPETERIARIEDRIKLMSPEYAAEANLEARPLHERLLLASTILIGKESYREWRRGEIIKWTSLSLGAVALLGMIARIRRQRKRSRARSATGPCPIADAASTSTTDTLASHTRSEPSPPPASRPTVNPEAAPLPPAAAKPCLNLFISFSTSDLDFVQNTFAPALAQAGHRPWYSADSIRPADLWERSILSGLESCDWFLVVMSPHAVSSKWVRLETHWATEHLEGRILPLMLVRCDPWKLHMKLGNVQYVDFERSPVAFEDLIEIIEAGAQT